MCIYVYVPNEIYLSSEAKIYELLAIVVELIFVHDISITCYSS